MTRSTGVAALLFASRTIERQQDTAEKLLTAAREAIRLGHRLDAENKALRQALASAEHNLTIGAHAMALKTIRAALSPTPEPEHE